MMKEYVTELLGVFLRAGFYFVPFLVLFSFGNLKKYLKVQRTRRAFLWTVVPFGLLYLTIGTGSKRYMLIPMLLLACLSGAGLSNLSGWIHRIPGVRRFPVRKIFLVLAALIVLETAEKLAMHSRKHFVGEFADEVSRELPQKTAFYAVDCNAGTKVAGLLEDMECFHYYQFDSWTEAVNTHFAIHQTDLSQCFFMTRVPRKYGEQDFKLWFRENFGVYPFELVKSTPYESYNYLLLRFDGKTGDGMQTHVRQDVLPYFNDRLVQRHQAGEWTEADYSRLFQKANADAGSFAVLPQGTFLNGRYLIRDMFFTAEANAVKKLTLYNALMWPQDVRDVELVYDRNAIEDEQKGNIRSAVSDMRPRVVSEKSIDSPLLLNPGILRIPDSHKILSLTSFVPAYFRQSDRFEFLPAEDIRLSNAKQQTIRYAVRDRRLNLTTECEMKVCKQSVDGIADYAGRILVVTDPSSAATKLGASLAEMLPNGKVDFVNLQKTGYSIINQPNPELDAITKQYDFILFNATYEMMSRPWAVPFQTDPYMDKYMTELVKSLRAKSPSATIAILLPQVPPPYECRYPLVDSPQLARLSHYRVCSMFSRWLAKHPDSRISLIPAYAVLDYRTDYSMFSDEEHIATSCALNDSGSGKVLHMVLAYIAASVADQTPSMPSAAE